MGKVIKFPNLLEEGMVSKVVAYYKNIYNDKDFLETIEYRVMEFLELPAFKKATEPLNIDGLEEEEVKKLKLMLNEIVVSLGYMCQEILDLELKLYRANKKKK